MEFLRYSKVPQKTCNLCSGQQVEVSQKLISSFLQQAKTQLCPYFPSHRIYTVTWHKAVTEKSNSYFISIASAPQVLHPFASFTSGPCGIFTPWIKDTCKHKLSTFKECAQNPPKSTHKLASALLEKAGAERPFCHTPNHFCISSVMQVFHMNAFLSHETNAPCTWKS